MYTPLSKIRRAYKLFIGNVERKVSFGKLGHG
jgi:hypothetical protein